MSGGHGLGEGVDWSVVYHWAGPPRLRMERAELPGGRRQHRVVAQDGRPGVVVLALDDDGAVLLVRQHRPAVGTDLWELPRGFGEEVDGPLDDDATLLAAAGRELREETGLELTDARVLGRWRPDSGLLAGEVGAVVGRAVGTGEMPVADPAVTAVRWCPPGRLHDLVSSGAVEDGLTLAALALWWAGSP